MTTLVLDRTLKEAEWNDTHYPRPEVKEEIEAGCLAKNAVERDWNTKTTENEIVFASTVPDGADLYHKNYLDYLSRTFGHHNSIVLAPQHFWYTGLCEIAQTVIKHPETHRKLFTRDPEGKIDIIVRCDDESEPLRMDAIYQEMIGLVPIDTTLFLPTFFDRNRDVPDGLAGGVSGNVLALLQLDDDPVWASTREASGDDRGLGGDRLPSRSVGA